MHTTTYTHTPIGCNDLWIACHALADESTLVTHNLDEFNRIDGLLLENWADWAATIVPQNA